MRVSTLEHTQIAEEWDLQGRFLNNVIDPVLATIRTLCEFEYGSKAELDELQGVLPSVISVGSSKSIAVSLRQKYEPDIAFKIDEIERAVSELKFSVTCGIQDAYDEELDDKFRLQTSGSARHIFGTFPVLEFRHLSEIQLTILSL